MRQPLPARLPRPAPCGCPNTGRTPGQGVTQDCLEGTCRLNLPLALLVGGEAAPVLSHRKDRKGEVAFQTSVFLRVNRPLVKTGFLERGVQPWHVVPSHPGAVEGPLPRTLRSTCGQGALPHLSVRVQLFLPPFLKSRG